jgi:hypothetical protein
VGEVALTEFRRGATANGRKEQPWKMNGFLTKVDGMEIVTTPNEVVEIRMSYRSLA